MTLLAPEASADAPRKNEFYLGIGPKIVLRKDQIKSPRVYLGIAALPVIAGYNRTRASDAHRLNLGLFKSTIRSQKDWEYLSWPDGETRSTEGDPLTSVRLRYGYLRTAYARGPWRINVGPAFDADIQHATYLAGPYGVDGFYGVFALDARAEFSVQPNTRHRISADLALPLVAWVARSPYALSNSEQIMANVDHNALKAFFRYLGQGRAHALNQLQAVRLSVLYRFQPHSRWSFSAEAESRLLIISKPRPLLAHDYGLNLRLGYHF